MSTKDLYPSIIQAFILLGVYLGLALMLGFFFSGLIKFDEASYGFVTFFSYVIPMVILAVFALKNTNLQWRQVFGRGAGGDGITYALLAMLVLANTFIVDPILSFFPVPNWLEEILRDLVKPNLGSILTLTFAAAFLEEYIFRGIVLRGFLKNYPPGKAILWSAAFFGIFHFNPWQLFAAFVIGVYMGWLYYRTQSLWPCIFVHFVNNSLASVTFLVYGQEDMAIYDFAQDPLLAALSIIGGAAVVYFIYKVLDKRLPAPQPITELT
ncbi:MAG: type II CAAX endopeptidase family protein, partial [Bacteroidota bacterium]